MRIFPRRRAQMSHRGISENGRNFKRTLCSFSLRLDCNRFLFFRVDVGCNKRLSSCNLFLLYLKVLFFTKHTHLYILCLLSIARIFIIFSYLFFFFLNCLRILFDCIVFFVACSFYLRIWRIIIDWFLLKIQFNFDNFIRWKIERRDIFCARRPQKNCHVHYIFDRVKLRLLVICSSASRRR